MLRQDFLSKKIEMLGFAEEVGFIGRQQVDHGLQFFRLLAIGEKAVVLGEGLEAVMTQAFLQTSDQQNLFRIGEADAGDFVDEPLKQAEFLLGDGGFAH